MTTAVQPAESNASRGAFTAGQSAPEKGVVDQEDTRAKIHRAASLITLAQHRLQRYGSDSGDVGDVLTNVDATDLSNALEMAWEILADAADDFDYFRCATDSGVAS